MATTWIKALHIVKGKTVAQTLTDRTDYAKNPEKTAKGELVTGYECDPMTCDTEWLLVKRQYTAITEREQGKRNVLAYHVRQSFAPGEITPEKANELGRELALRFTKGKHQFIVATHIDRLHCHNHIIFNSTAIDATHKFHDFKQSAKAVRRLSDQICAENELSVILDPQPSQGHNENWQGNNKPPSKKEIINRKIDEILAQKPADFNTFLNAMQAAGFKVKRGKRPSICAPCQKKPHRFDSLGANYSKQAIIERIEGKRIVKTARPITPPQPPQKLDLMIDIKSKIQAGKGKGYENWAKVFNLKQAAQTLVFLEENGFDDYDKLAAQAARVSADFNERTTQIKSKENRMREIAELQKYIGQYSKTREVYAEYKKRGWSKKYLAEFESDIALHRAAKNYFNSLNLKKLPKIKELKQEYAELDAAKKKLYIGYREARDEMRRLAVAKENANRLLREEPTRKNRANERE